jgi:dGTPase
MAIEAGCARAVYAANPGHSRGRLFAEAPSVTRNDFRRDCDRIIHATAFRRLKHKTQVFVFHEGDHYRTRLTHSLEVAQIARALARALGLDEDLSEALALAHDLGHPPFGHAGERALAGCMASLGGFDHNAQTLRVVTELERRYPGFDGLNLTWETLEGIVKHNGPLADRAGCSAEAYGADGLPESIRVYDAVHELDLWSYPSAEAQAAAIADDIAYDAHDIDDGLRAGLFAIEDTASVPLVGDIVGAVRAQYPHLDTERLVHELSRRLISQMIEDVVAEARRRLERTAPRSADDVRRAGQPLIGFSPAMARADGEIKGFLSLRMYRQARIARIMREAEGVVRDLFERYSKNPADLPLGWTTDAEASGSQISARKIADFIAGMTDRYALVEHARLFAATPELR